MAMGLDKQGEGIFQDAPLSDEVEDESRHNCLPHRQAASEFDS
jgi:hypothetical protein